MLEQLTIFEKTYQLILWLYPAVRKFPKAQRFVLGQQIENTALETLGRPAHRRLAGQIIIN